MYAKRQQRGVWEGNVCVSHCKYRIWLSWLTEGSGGLICHHWWGDRGCRGQNLSDLEVSVCSNSDGQTETEARQSTLTSPSTPRSPAQPWPWAQQNCKVGSGSPPPPPPQSRPLHPGAAVSHQVAPPNHLSLTPQTTTATTPTHPSPSPPTVQSGQALLHLTSLAGVEQRPTRHQDNETGVQWPRKGTPVCLCESEHGKRMWVCVHVCTCVTEQPWKGV